MKTYYIVDNSYYGDRGNLLSTEYQIRYRKKFLWLFPYWKYITHRECYYSGCDNVRTEFSTVEEAEKFIKEVLCPGKTYSGFSTTVVGEINCS